MRQIFFAFLFLLLSASIAMAEVVTTTDGRQIQLNDDGTYEVLSEPERSSEFEIYGPLNFAEFELFPEDWIGRPVWVTRSSFGLTPITKSDIESGRIVINAGTGTAPNLLIADISSLGRDDLVSLVRGERYMAFGTIERVLEATSAEAEQEVVLLDVDFLVFDTNRILRIQGGQERVRVR